MSAPPPFENKKVCNKCGVTFTLITRQHHCRNCGRSFCNACSKANIPLPHYKLLEPQRVCDECLVHVQQFYKQKAATAGSASPAQSGGPAVTPASSLPPAAAPSAASPAAAAVGGGGSSFSSSSQSPSASTFFSPLSSASSPSPASSFTSSSSSFQEDEAKISPAVSAPLRPTPSSSAAVSSAPSASSSSSAASAAASAKPKAVARTQFQSFGSSGFSGFGRASSVQYDLSGNLDDQCRDAIKNNDSAGVTKLLTAGANARYVDHTGNSLLHLAAMFDRYDIARQLIDKGASLTEKNPAGETPLDIAPPSMQHKLNLHIQQRQQMQAAA